MFNLTGKVCTNNGASWAQLGPDKRTQLHFGVLTFNNFIHPLKLLLIYVSTHTQYRSLENVIKYIVSKNEIFNLKSMFKQVVMVFLHLTPQYWSKLMTSDLPHVCFHSVSWIFGLDAICICSPFCFFLMPGCGRACCVIKAGLKFLEFFVCLQQFHRPELPQSTEIKGLSAFLHRSIEEVYFLLKIFL